METNRKVVTANNNIDIVKFSASILILGSHCLPIFYDEMLNYYYGQFLFRFCVPFFFITTGYFFEAKDKDKQREFIFRLMKIYLISTIMYLPLILSESLSIKVLIKCWILGYRHLWYLIATVIALVLWIILRNKFTVRVQYSIAMALLIIGVFFDEYYKVVDISCFNVIGKAFEYINGARNGIFMAFPMMTIGCFLRNRNETHKKNIYIIGLVLSLLASLFESKMFYSIGGTLDLTIFNWIPAVFIFCIALSGQTYLKNSMSKIIRKMSTIIYIIHPYFIFLYSELGMKHYNCFIMVLISSVFTAFIILKILKRSVYEESGRSNS